MRYIFAILLFALCLATPTGLSAAEKIWDVAEQKYISEKSLMDRLGQSRHILLGVQTDNKHHHELAAKIIETLDKAGRNPVILLGNVERSKQNAFAIFTQRHQNSPQVYDATGLDMLLGWADSGAGHWSVVKPLFDMAMLRKLPLIASGLSRYELGEIYRDGPKGLPQDMTSTLRPLLTTPLPKQTAIQMTKDINREYCGTLPPNVVEKFIAASRAQNGLIALNMAATNPKTAVLVASSKHIIRDTGVPRILNELMGKSKIITLLFGEKGQDIPSGQVDYIWYSAAIPHADPCGFLNP
ncbi:MAG: ChaN family lipoprotein [Emcibacter sp.]|nr:ChaN family lipoprotein [Emcibacter sp.]